jgi:hypothetical protein
MAVNSAAVEGNFNTRWQHWGRKGGFAGGTEPQEAESLFLGSLSI